MATEKTLLEAISNDRALGSSILFDHRHTDATPVFHVEIVDLWRCADEMVLIEAFRDAAKTTLAEEFLVMEGAFGNFNYCVLFCETYDKACQRIEAMAHEIRRNAKMTTLFGQVLARKPLENKLFFKSGALIECFGWEQEITGMKYHDHRPDRAYLDDVENMERVRDTAAVDATIRKIYRELWPAMDKRRRKMRITQTPRAADCLVTRLRADPSWLARSFPICIGDIDSPDAVPLWPAKFPMEWIRAERDKYARQGLLRDFMQEYMLESQAASTKPFTEEMIRSMDIAPLSYMPKYAIYDPARTANAATSDRTGKVVISRLGGKILVHESAGSFWKPDEIRTDVFDTQAKHGAIIGIEKNSLDEHLLQPIRMEMIRRQTTFTLKPLQAPQDRNKAAFVMGLQPFFTAGDIILVGGRGMHPQLVAEILNFPAGRLDIINALAYAPRMLGGTPIYEDFSDANVGDVPVRPMRIYASWNASGAETVCVVLVHRGRQWCVCADYAQIGPPMDAAKTISAQLRADFPNAAIETYVPAELHDQWQRIPLVPALRGLKYTPWRGEHVGVARGCLADLVRTEMHRARCLTVAPRARDTITALAGEYKYPMFAGKQSTEPETGLSRLIAEAVETLTAITERVTLPDEDGANVAYNVNGTAYRTSLPPRSRV